MKSTGGTIENELFWKGLKNSLEPETIWIWEKLLNRGVVSIIDIGANSGLYSLLSCAINNKVNVIAFEPSYKTYIKLNDNISINNFNIITEQIAISNINGKLMLYDLVDRNQTNASLSPKMIKENPDCGDVVLDEYEVNVRTLDDYIKNSAFKSVDLIKIDVELHEPEVFEGMMDTLLIHKPFLLFEVLTDEVADKLNVIFSRLSDYSIFEFDKHKNEYVLIRINKLSSKPNGDWNYLACHKIKESIIIDIIKG